MLNMASGKYVCVRHSSYLIISTDDLLNTFDKNVETGATLLDFSEACDRVGHEHLLKKVEAIGVIGCNLRWISSFLTNREQTAVFALCTIFPERGSHCIVT